MPTKARHNFESVEYIIYTWFALVLSHFILGFQGRAEGVPIGGGLGVFFNDLPTQTMID